MKQHRQIDHLITPEQEKRYKYLLGDTELLDKFLEARRDGKPILNVLLERSNVKKSKTTAHTISSSSGGVQSSLSSSSSKQVHRHNERQADDFSEDGVSLMFTESPFFVKGGQMRPYQIQGLNWLISLYDHQLNGILADEMGLGKTLQTLSLLGYLKHYKNIPGPHLLITPKSTLNNWMNEIGKWIPDLEGLVLIGDKEERQEIIKKLKHPENFNVCVTSYEMCLIEKSAIQKVNWHYLIIDEAHRIKNENSILSQIVRIFKAKHRLLLTGTPLQNNLHELWALLNFLLPDIFPDAESFDAWTDEQTGEDKQVIEQLRKLLEPFLLRRLKMDVEHSLAPKKEINLYVGMSPMQKAWYRKILERDLGSIVNSGGAKVRLLNVVMQLRKCTNHPYLFDGAEPGPPFVTDENMIRNAEKMRILDKLLERLGAAGSRVLLFSQMSRMLDILEDYCILRGYQYCRIDGQTTHEERIAGIHEFNRPGSEKFIFLLTTRAGGLGINLATADIVILYDSDWNPQVDLQAQDRAHRIGQLKQVYVFRFITENSIEEKVLEKAMQKLRLDQLVIQQGKLTNANKPLTQEEMLAMIKHGAEELLKDGKESSLASSEKEASIEDILKRGEEKTKELREKYKNAGFDELNRFKMDATIDTLQPLLTHVNHRFMMLDAPRERKAANYAIDGYYREALRTGPSKAKSTRAPMPKNYQHIYDFQFFPERLLELREREVLAHQKAANYIIPEALDETLERKQERELEQSFIDQAIPLTEQEQEEKDLYLKQGFANWTKRDYNAFLKAIEKHGKNVELIAKEIEGKTFEEVQEYCDTFWQNFTELADAEKIRNILEKTESRLRRLEIIQTLLREKVALKEKNPNAIIPLNYYNNKGKEYTEEEDEFIILQMNSLGYDLVDLYDRIREEIIKEPIFRFDWFIKTRTSNDLMKRGHKLVGFIEREAKERETKRIKMNSSK